MTWSASGRTGALAAVLALSSAGLVAAAPPGGLLSGPLDGAAALAVQPLSASAVVVSALAVLFLVTELCLLHVEVRREAYSLTLAGVPIALGLLLCDSWELVAARLLGSAAAFALQGTSAAKASYNLASYTFECALGVMLLHLLVSPSSELTAQTALACSAVLLTVDQLMTALIVRIISWHQGRLTARQSVEVHLPALVCTALSASGAFGLLLLTRQGPVGGVVLTVFVGSAALAYRSFQVLHRRHQALAQAHEFVALNDQDLPTTKLAGIMLGQVRELMRASSAELLLDDPDIPLHLTVDEDTPPRVLPADEGAGRRASDLPALAAALPAGEPVLLGRKTHSRTQRAWLAARGVNDAVVVPLTATDGTSSGVLLVCDRLGNTGTFTREDQTLLATLAGHLTVSISSSRRRDRLRYEATHDVLTGLGNRALLHQAISSHLERGAQAVVLVLDLDRFKEVNDTLGHHVGDALLQVIAERLVAALPPDATVARLGGDEFAAVVPLAGDHHRQREGDAPGATADRIARKVVAALTAPVQLPEAALSTRASIGVALLPADHPGDPSHRTAGDGAPTYTPPTAADLLRHADTAMYAAKESQAGVLIYTDDLDCGRAERLALLADLHLALERGELTVAYQPKLDLHSNQITSVEALVRWQHPRLGLLSPDTFIPLAEANGLIGPLTRTVLQTALRQCASWRATGHDLAVAVNLSARSVNNPDLPEQISDALLEAGVPATRLILEVTESAVMADPDRAVTILERINAIGVTLSLDDFGTGYSSLSYLQQLPVQEVKIDRSFIIGLAAGNTSSHVLVRNIINLGSGLGLRVVAEGVEDANTLDLLRDLGCHLAQGYHIGRPQAPQLFTNHLQQSPTGHRRLQVVAS